MQGGVGHRQEEVRGRLSLATCGAHISDAAGENLPILRRDFNGLLAWLLTWIPAGNKPQTHIS